METNKVHLCIESSFDELFSLESIIKLTQQACLEREENLVHFGLPKKDMLILSEERNHYINLLTIALQKVDSIKSLNLIIEREVNYLEQYADNGC